MRRPEVRDVVTYRDVEGTDHPAFVTAVWGEGSAPAVNLVFLSDRDGELDHYGRRLQRATSVQHTSNRPGGAMAWRHPDEVPLLAPTTTTTKETT